DIETALAYATRVIVLDEGCIAADNVPRKVFADASLLDRSGLKPTQSWLVGRELGLHDVFSPRELEGKWIC
ncbi:MAG: ATP-binding protein, partial [Bacillota bacterium]